ncbi:hypothetical protein ACFRMQ_07390 [Kitasatospora sp. NPDC056783]|uniref:hypothetical protein n=1 Tax=Kitasatospora sp. NPDC056783 TaxID=3345943 RepID=UPI00367A6ADB
MAALLLGAELLATGWSLASIAAFQAGHGTWALGAGQRLQVLLVALWLGLLALGVARSADPDTPDGEAGEAERTGRAGRPGTLPEGRPV